MFFQAAAHGRSLRFLQTRPARRGEFKQQSSGPRHDGTSVQSLIERRGQLRCHTDESVHDVLVSTLGGEGENFGDASITGKSGGGACMLLAA